MNIFYEWEARQRHQEVLRDVAQRQAWKLGSAILQYEETATLVHRMARWFTRGDKGPRPFITTVDLSEEDRDLGRRAS